VLAGTGRIGAIWPLPLKSEARRRVETGTFSRPGIIRQRDRSSVLLLSPPRPGAEYALEGPAPPAPGFTPTTYSRRSAGIGHLFLFSCWLFHSPQPTTLTASLLATIPRTVFNLRGVDCRRTVHMRCCIDSVDHRPTVQQPSSTATPTTHRTVHQPCSIRCHLVRLYRRPDSGARLGARWPAFQRIAVPASKIPAGHPLPRAPPSASVPPPASPTWCRHHRPRLRVWERAHHRRSHPIPRKLASPNTRHQATSSSIEIRSLAWFAPDRTSMRVV